MLSLRAKVDLGTMAMKRYSAFPKAPALVEPHHQMVSCHIQDARWGVYSSSEMQLVFSIAPADWATNKMKFYIYMSVCVCVCVCVSHNGGVRGVMVTDVGNEHGDASPNPILFVFRVALILLGKVWIQLFSLQLWVNSRAGCFLWP